MRKIINKANSKWILLFLFTFFSVGVQGQYNEVSVEWLFNNFEEGTYVNRGNGIFVPLDESTDLSSSVINSDGTWTNDYNPDMLGGPFINGVNANGVTRVYVGNVPGLRGVPANGTTLAEVIIVPMYKYILPTGEEITGFGQVTFATDESVSPDIPFDSGCSLVCPIGYFVNQFCQCEKNICTTKCESGLTLNSDTCECKLLPPCWGTTVKGLMPTGSGDQSKLVEALKAMVSSFFKSSNLLETMKVARILNPAELSQGFQNYLDGGDILGKISLGIVAIEYNSNPTTENFMKIIVEGALLFLPAPVALGYSIIDSTIYQKYSNGESFAQTLAKKMAEKSNELFNCDLGSGVYGLIHD